jgi:hypothetical protein
VSEVDAQTIRFRFLGVVEPFTYTVTASSTPGSYTFSGALRDDERMDHVVGGDTDITVSAPAETGASADRSLSTMSVAPGGEVVVTITASNYGLAGGVTETLPSGFTYVTSSLDGSQVTELDGNKVRFTLQGDTSFTYTVTVSSTAGSYAFSGALRDEDGMDHVVGGDTDITVSAPAETGASAGRSLSTMSVAPGGEVVVTITASNYGLAGGVTETLPSGFTYVTSSLDGSQVTELDGNKVRFTLQGDTSFTYTVTVSSTAGSYAFSGALRDDDRMDHVVGGDTDITVSAPAETATPR